MDREMRSSTLPVRTRYRLSSVVERGPPKPDVDCSIQSAGANVYCLGWAHRDAKRGSLSCKAAASISLSDRVAGDYKLCRST